jgi:hypothetical protein
MEQQMKSKSERDYLAALARLAPTLTSLSELAHVMMDEHSPI